MKIGLIWMAGVAVLVIAPSSARATIYQCLDASGAKVLTDTPAQLKNCTPLTAGPMTPSTRPPAAVQEPTAGSSSLAPTPSTSIVKIVFRPDSERRTAARSRKAADAAIVSPPPP